MLFNDIKKYIKDNIELDSDISFDISIKSQYTYGEMPNPPEILLYFADDTENYQATIFMGETVSTVLLQIIVMAKSLSFNGNKYNAQMSCNILSNKIKDMFDKLKVKENLNNVLNIRRVQKSDSIPYEKGTVAYYSILRYQIEIKNNL